MAACVFLSCVLMTTGAYIMPKKTIPGWWIWVSQRSPCHCVMHQSCEVIQPHILSMCCSSPHDTCPHAEPSHQLDANGGMPPCSCPHAPLVWPLQAYWINPMAWAQQSLAINEFTAARWNKIDPVTGLNLGQQLLNDHSYKNSLAYKWGGVGVILAWTIGMNCLIWLALAVLKGGCAVERSTSFLVATHFRFCSLAQVV